jgi:hypothetical protein
MTAITQEILTDLPLGKRDAEKVARRVLLEQLGSTPHIARAREEGINFVFDIEVTYPRVIWDESGLEARKTRFISVGKVGEIVVDRNKGRVIDRPGYMEVARAIEEKLDFISGTVEKALVRVAADRFSLLPFPVHLHTPVVDVLSWLLIKDTLPLSELEVASDQSQAKLLAALEPLSQVNLIQVQDQVVTPGPVLIGIEAKYPEVPRQLEKAMAHFFREGYQFIDTVKQVLGAHLTASSVLFERAETSGEVTLLTLDQIENEFRRFYPMDRITKLPRYLVQLEGIGVAVRQRKAGVNLWSADPTVYDEFRGDHLLEPLSALLSGPVS